MKNKKYYFWILAFVFILFFIYYYFVSPAIYKEYFKNELLNPTLVRLNLYSPDASNLMLGTAMQESCIGRLSGNVFQIDLTTAEDVNKNYLAYRPELNKLVMQYYDNTHSLEWNLNNNIPYQVAMARIVYLRVGGALPDGSNSAALGEYWKKHYNTYLGKGTAAQYKAMYDHYLFTSFWRCVFLFHWGSFFKHILNT